MVGAAVVLHGLCGTLGGQAVAADTGLLLWPMSVGTPSAQGKGVADPRRLSGCQGCTWPVWACPGRGRGSLVQGRAGRAQGGQSQFWRSGRAASVLFPLTSRLTLDEGLHYWTSIFLISKIDNLTSLRRRK